MGESEPPRGNTRNQIRKMIPLQTHPQAELLTDIVLGDTNVSSSGFPYISDKSFNLFIQRIPHLFRDGHATLRWLETLKGQLPTIDGLSTSDAASINRAIQVLRTVAFTAGVTAPCDLWLLKQILSAHRRLGITDDLHSADGFEPAEYARRRNLSLRHLTSNLTFIYSRGYLRKEDSRFFISDDSRIAAAIQEVSEIGERYRINLVPALVDWFELGDESHRESFLTDWLRIDAPEQPTGSWIADRFQIELGYRLLPLILSLKVAGLTKELTEGATIKIQVPRILPIMMTVFEHAGVADDGRVTELGARVFERGPGPFGIIGAYHPYLNNLAELLRSLSAKVHVQRGENVAASQDANRKTFEQANDSLDAFCKATSFQYSVFIEHAVGRGEATRQRLQRSGEDRIRYFGADLEDSAIDQAVTQQRQGFLPHNMEFIRSADIGNPERVIDFLAERGLADEPTVMMVGNGFHEVRQQTNQKMIDVFHAYEKAGFVLIFTEESALEDDDLLNTAWNTYHAGFRYVHELSGQGLRPAAERKLESAQSSWRRCATEAGYTVLENFSYKSRSIYPYKRPERENPSISETYFCVPRQVTKVLAV